MKTTNKHNIPDYLVAYMKQRRYSKGASRVSVTDLIRAPRIGILNEFFDEHMEEDVTDRVWALFGTAVHSMLEQAGDETHLAEERLFLDVNGWTISGGIDVQELGMKNGFMQVAVNDYKVTSVYAIKSIKPEWEAQVNSYAELVDANKEFKPVSLRIIAFLRDWRRAEVDRQSDYPPAPVQVIEIPLWDKETRVAYLEERVRVRQQAEFAFAMGEPLPLCSDEDRWMRGGGLAVLKPGNKNAYRVFQDRALAEEFLAKKKLSLKSGGDTVVIEERIGEPIRCKQDWCGVAEFCEQWQQEKSKYE